MVEGPVKVQEEGLLLRGRLDGHLLVLNTLAAYNTGRLCGHRWLTLTFFSQMEIISSFISRGAASQGEGPCNYDVRRQSKIEHYCLSIYKRA